MRITPGFMLNYIKLYIVLISNEDDILKKYTLCFLHLIWDFFLFNYSLLFHLKKYFVKVSYKIIILLLYYYEDDIGFYVIWHKADSHPHCKIREESWDLPKTEIKITYPNNEMTRLLRFEASHFSQERRSTSKEMLLILVLFLWKVFNRA